MKPARASFPSRHTPAWGAFSATNSRRPGYRTLIASTRITTVMHSMRTAISIPRQALHGGSDTVTDTAAEQLLLVSASPLTASTQAP